MHYISALFTNCMSMLRCLSYGMIRNIYIYIYIYIYKYTYITYEIHIGHTQQNCAAQL